MPDKTDKTDVDTTTKKKKQGRKSQQKYLSFGPPDTNVGIVRQNTIVFDNMSFTNMRSILKDVKTKLKEGSDYIQIRVNKKGEVEVYANKRGQ